MAIDRRMLVLMPQILWTGVSVAFYSGILVDAIAASVVGTDAEQQYKAVLAMIAFGVGEILGCFFIGWIVDRFGSKNAAWANVGICLVMTVVTVAFLVVNEYNALAYIMAFMWGIEDSATNTHCQEMLGFEFDNNSEPFSVYNGFQALSCVVF